MIGGIMNNIPMTLDQIFEFKRENLSRDQLSEFAASERMVSLKERVSRDCRDIKWPGILDEITEKIGDLLDISIPHIMINAWNKARTLDKYLDREKYPRDETVLVPLVEHTIRSVHHPSMEILVNENPVCRIEFDIKVEIAVEGMVLKIRDGRIRGIKTGKCKGKGSIEYEGLSIVQQELKPIALLGSIDLGDGIPIAA
jgi:hypothetical protein